MTRRRVIIAILLATFIVFLSCKDKGRTQVASKDNVQTRADLGIKKSHGAEKLEGTGSGGKPIANDSSWDEFAMFSMIQVISNPEKFDGKTFMMVGFVSLEFEGYAIYLHEEDYWKGLTKNGLWLNLTEDFVAKNKEKYHKKYVLVKGTFDAKFQGHMGLCSGAIGNITRLELWPERRKARSRIR